MAVERQRQKLIVAVVMAVVLAACQPAQDFPAAMAAGERLIEAQAWEEALEHFDRLQRRFPEELQPLNKLAFVADRLRRPEAAIPVLEERIAAGGPEVYAYHEILGTLLENSVELPLAAHNQRGARRALQAEHHYRESLRLRPVGATYLKLSRLATRTGRNDEALAVAAEGVAAVPGDAQLHAWYGDLLMKRRRYGEAEEVLQRALELGGGSAYPHYVLGLVYLHTDRPADARRHLETATELRAEAHGGWYQLANACERLGDLEARDRALAEFRTRYQQTFEAGGPG